MSKDHVLEQLGFIRLFDLRQLNHVAIAAPDKIVIFIEYISDATRHPRGKVSAGPAQHDHAAAGHVFATMIADTFDDGTDTTVANAEAFTGHSIDVGFAAGGSIEGDIADDHILG